MKIYIGNYKTYIGPYQIAQMLCFWAKRDALEGYPDYVHNFGKWLAEDKNGNDSWLTKACQWLDSKRRRKIKIKIDSYDLWNLDNTLSYIIYPLLVEFRKDVPSTAMVDKGDVPEYLHSTYGTGDDMSAMYSHEAWLYVIDEMIHSFDPEWENKYGFGAENYVYENYKKNLERQQNGHRLFGRYLGNLWQ